MNQARAIELAKDWYLAYLDKYPPTPYEQGLIVHTEAEETGEGWYVQVWSDAYDALFGLMVFEDGEIDFREES